MPNSSLTTVLLECLLECSGHLASAIQAAWLFVSVKVSVLSREHRLDRRMFPPVLGPAVGASGGVSSTENV